jgi:lipoate-protein ligase A
MRYLRNNSTDVYYNMAFDEYALEQLPLDEPLFYLWQNRSAVIVGINQNVYAEVDINYLRQHDIALARRITGGGAVYHDLGNLNYTIVGRSSDIERDYPQYASHMIHALQALGIQAELSGRNDILVDGRKVSGYAKRVYKDRLMVHGTLMYDVDIETLTYVLTPPTDKLTTKGISSVKSRVVNLKDYLPGIASIRDFSNTIERYLSREYQDEELLLTQTQLAEIRAIATSKFATPEWVYGRSPSHTITHAKRLPCGNVAIHLDIRRGIIAQCSITGDFLGNTPISAIETLLQGCLYERTALQRLLVTVDISNYLDNTDYETFVNLLLNS